MTLERRGLALLQKVVGETAADRVAGVYRDRFLPRLESLTYARSNDGKRSRERLREIKNRYAGERGFIIGNGPSLTRTDLRLLKGELTFGLNRGYLLFDRLGGPSTFMVAVNRYVAEQFGDEMLTAPSQKFFSWRSRRYLADRGSVTFIRRAPRFTFSPNVATQGAWEGATVTYVAMQIAFHLGFREVVLVGVDHSFATSGPANQLVTAHSPDPNHFDPNYFGPGVKWQLPDLAMSEIAYKLARSHFEADGRRIVDATVGGKLTIFPKIDFEASFRSQA